MSKRSIVEKKKRNEVHTDDLKKADSHIKSAEHHEKAAKYHREAAKHLEEGNYQKAVNSAVQALEQNALAEHQVHEVKHHDMVD